MPEKGQEKLYRIEFDKDGQLKPIKTKCKKIAIIGYAPGSRHLAPYDDPEWECWGMNELYLFVPKLDVLFEIHPRNVLNTEIRNRNHEKWLMESKIPVYMQRHWDDMPNSIKFPKDYLVEKWGSYYTNSVSYMIAFALECQPDEIGIWGVDMATDEEYSKQRPSVEYFMGIAKGIGRATGKPKVIIPPQSDITRNLFLYGYDHELYSLMCDRFKSRKAELARRQQEYAVGVDHQKAAYQTMSGALDDLNYIERAWLSMYENRNKFEGQENAPK